MEPIIVSPGSITQAETYRQYTRVGVVCSASIDIAEAALAAAEHQVMEHGHATIVCASAFLARRLGASIAEGPLAGKAEAVTVRDIALGILALPAVQESVKRTDRILDENELDVLVEDLKITGTSPQRLRRMIDSFYRHISNGELDAADWLADPDEAKVFAVLEENLEARRACLPCEVAAKAHRGLVAAGITVEPQTFVVCGFDALSASAQQLLEYLSGGEIIAFGTDPFCACADEPYSSPAKMTAFSASEDTVILKATAPRAESRPLEVLETPYGEFERIADLAASSLEEGVSPEEIAIAAPNATWCTRIAQTLGKRGIASFADAPSRKIKGDPRDAKACGPIKLAAFVKLLENPDDITAWRTFVGAGDYLLRSDGFLELLAYAREHSLDVLEAAREMGDPAGVDRFTESFRKLLGPIREYDGLCAVWANGTAADVRSAMEAHDLALGKPGECLGSDGDRPNLAAFLDACRQTSADDAPTGICITPYSRTTSHPSRILIISGMVDGFLPKRDAVEDAFDIDHRARAFARDRRFLQSLESTARQTVHHTAFDHDALENAAALGMATDRIYFHDGRRMARLRPSSLMQ